MGIERRGADIVPIAVGLIWLGDRLVVGRRDDDAPLAGFDEFPGGKCHAGESTSDAVRRECREETGLDIEVVALRLETEHEYPHGRLRLSFFDCRPVDDFKSGTSFDPRLHAPFRWARLDEVLELRFPPANKPLLDSLRQVPRPRAD